MGERAHLRRWRGGKVVAAPRPMLEPVEAPVFGVHAGVKGGGAHSRIWGKEKVDAALNKHWNLSNRPVCGLVLVSRERVRLRRWRGQKS